MQSAHLLLIFIGVEIKKSMILDSIICIPKIKASFTHTKVSFIQTQKNSKYCFYEILIEVRNGNWEKSNKYRAKKVFVHKKINSWKYKTKWYQCWKGGCK